MACGCASAGSVEKGKRSLRLCGSGLVPQGMGEMSVPKVMQPYLDECGEVRPEMTLDP